MVMAGTYEPTPLEKVVYGRGSIARLPELLDFINANKAFIVTGSSLMNKTPCNKANRNRVGEPTCRHV
jgi:alcohol dehydrogenase class IV